MIRVTVERLSYELPNGMYVPKATVVKEAREKYGL